MCLPNVSGAFICDLGSLFQFGGQSTPSWSSPSNRYRPAKMASAVDSSKLSADWTSTENQGLALPDCSDSRERYSLCHILLCHQPSIKRPTRKLTSNGVIRRSLSKYQLELGKTTISYEERTKSQSFTTNRDRVAWLYGSWKCLLELYCSKIRRNRQLNSATMHVSYCIDLQTLHSNPAMRRQ